MQSLLALLACVFAIASAAQTMSKHVVPQATASVSYDDRTGLFTYRYTFGNAASATNDIDEIAVDLRGSSIVNVTSPKGWKAMYVAGVPTLIWCACAEEGFVPPPDWIDRGQLLPSNYILKPNQTLRGFSFQSADPPGDGSFSARGFEQILVEGFDFPLGEEPDASAPDVVEGRVTAPLRQDGADPGGRRPAADGFLTFMTIKDGDVKTAPVLVDFELGLNGETVYADTLAATLNGVDVTGQFVTISPTRKRASFQISGNSPLKQGANVLVTKIDGLVPGASRTATDSDRIKFVVP